jgi:hypothetical protein
MQKSSQCQCCQMVYFHTENPNLGIFWRDLEWKTNVYFMAVWYVYVFYINVYFEKSIFLFLCGVSPFGMSMYMKFGIHSLWSFGTVFPFWYVLPRKPGNPWHRIVLSCVEIEIDTQYILIQSVSILNIKP